MRAIHVPNVALYQAKLRPDSIYSYIISLKIGHLCDQPTSQLNYVKVAHIIRC